MTALTLYAIDDSGAVTALGPVAITNGVGTLAATTPLTKFMLVASPETALTAYDPTTKVVFRSAVPEGFAVVPVSRSASGETVAATTAPATTTAPVAIAPVTTAPATTTAPVTVAPTTTPGVVARPTPRRCWAFPLSRRRRYQNQGRLHWCTDWCAGECLRHAAERWTDRIRVEVPRPEGSARG